MLLAMKSSYIIKHINKHVKDDFVIATFVINTFFRYEFKI